MYGRHDTVLRSRETAAPQEPARCPLTPKRCPCPWGAPAQRRAVVPGSRLVSLMPETRGACTQPRHRPFPCCSLDPTAGLREEGGASLAACCVGGTSTGFLVPVPGGCAACPRPRCQCCRERLQPGSGHRHGHGGRALTRGTTGPPAPGAVVLLVVEEESFQLLVSIPNAGQQRAGHRAGLTPQAPAPDPTALGSQRPL